MSHPVDGCLDGKILLVAGNLFVATVVDNELVSQLQQPFGPQQGVQGAILLVGQARAEFGKMFTNEVAVLTSTEDALPGVGRQRRVNETSHSSFEFTCLRFFLAPE